jgi:DNA-binding response OmpR family regulator
MKRLLLVDDDGLVISSYRNRLSAHGFQVNVAPDANTAMTVLRGVRPDLVVLDLMMPGISGVEVLKFIRSEPKLATLPVIVLTNAYMNDLGFQADALGVERALLKAQCSPSVLMSVIDEVLLSKEGQPAAETSPLPNAATSEESSLGAPSVLAETRPVVQQPGPPIEDKSVENEPTPKASAELLTQGPALCADLRRLFQAFSRETNQETQQQQLQNFYRKVHSLTASMGLTEYAQISQISAIFEALLYTLIEKPGCISPSTVRTVASLVDFVELLFEDARQSGPRGPLSALILAVDDDPVSNRLAVSALQRAKLQAQSTEDPLVAWQWLNREHYDLFLLDIEMPGMNGFDLCKRLRAVQGYEKTPVIYVTSHSDFENRTKSTLSGGGDLIAKPILPIELAAKVMMHLGRSRVTKQ